MRPDPQPAERVDADRADEPVAEEAPASSSRAHGTLRAQPSSWACTFSLRGQWNVLPSVAHPPAQTRPRARSTATAV
ncbi:MAG: hypothetical protein U0470_13055 [Anaerolineae bacterium]